MQANAPPKLLSGYRVLELGDPAAMYAGKIFGDLGCDVIRIERPAGDPWRTLPPLAPWGDQELSATWIAYNTSKRSVALDIESADGRALLDPLVDAADLVIVSGSAPWMRQHRLQPSDLRLAGTSRDKLVAVAISPFGLEGPLRDFKGGDLVIQAAGGMLFLNGNEDRPPVRISEETMWAQAGAQACFVATAALLSAQRDGIGESIDVSAQEAIVAALVYVVPWWQHAAKLTPRRTLNGYQELAIPTISPCKDGYVCFRVSFGRAANRTQPLIDWMVEEGQDEGLGDVAWADIDPAKLRQEDADSYVRRIETFFRTKTRAELYDGARKRRVVLMPVMELSDVLGDLQMTARKFFTSLPDPAGRMIQFPGPLFRIVSGAPDGIADPSPSAPSRPGQHTAAVLEELAGGRDPLRSAPRASTARTTTRRGLLSGITVADFGWAVAGPVLSRFLAHHGATVIRIESNTRLDTTRVATPFRGRPSRNTSGYFDQHNAGKLSITLNLKHPEGRRLAFELALAADVVNENFLPGVLDKLGLGYEALREQRPDVVLISSSSQGQSGPSARLRGLGFTLQGLVGLCHLTGWPDRAPAGPGEPYTDTLVVWQAGAALMAALDYRRRTGQGMHLDVSQFEGVAHVLAPAIVHEQLTGTPHSRMGNASLARAPEGVFPCEGDERWCAISVEDDGQWRMLAGIIGYSNAEVPLERQDLAWRLAHRAALEASIARWTKTRDVQSVEDMLQARGIGAYKVASGEDIMSDRQLAARGHWISRDHPAMGEHLYEMPPFRLSEHEISVERSPRIGEHTDQVLKNVLGLTDEDLGRARAAGALN